jgi:hypothetical protein
MCYVNSTIEAAEASKKKLSTSVEAPKATAPAAEQKVVSPKADPAPASNRPAAAMPRPIADKDSVTKKSSKLLSFDDIDANAIQKSQQKKTDGDDMPVTMAGIIREFNQENVSELWHTYADNIRDTKGGAAALMTLNQPMVTDGATISVKLESELQKTQFTQIVIGLKNFIYSHIGFHPDIQVEVVKSAENTTKFYTPQDKLKRLMELNPALRRFQKELGLDLDYN